MLFSVAVVFATLLSVSWAGHPCPPKEELGTCSCTQDDFETDPGSTTISVPDQPSDFLRSTAPVSGLKKLLHGSLLTTVKCNASKSLFALEEVISLAFHRKTVDRLIISRLPPKREHTLTYLPSKWLKNTRVKIFEIQDTILLGDFIWLGNPFEGQEKSLLGLIAKRCYLYGALTFDTLHTVNTKGLNRLEYLEGLDLSYNHLTTVYSSAFKSPPVNLTSVVLSHNSLRTMESNAFQFLIKLKYIDLSRNLLESVTRGMFPSPAKLEHINLGWNSLKYLPTDFFNNMPSLKRVIVEHNFLYSMPERPWAPVWKNLTFVDVRDNFISCDCSLVWLLPMVPKTNTSKNVQLVFGKCGQNNFSNTYATQRELSTLTWSQLQC